MAEVLVYDLEVSEFERIKGKVEQSRERSDALPYT